MQEAVSLYINSGTAIVPVLDDLDGTRIVRMGSQGVSYRMRLAHPDAFQPRVIFFSDYPTENPTDWIACFTLKAAAVYSAVVGKDVDDDNMASHLLVSLAKFPRHRSFTSGQVEWGSMICMTGDDKFLPSGVSTKYAVESLDMDIEVAQHQEPKAAQGAEKRKTTTPDDQRLPEKSDVDGDQGSKKELEEIERLPKEVKQRIDAVYLVVGFLRDIFGVDDRQRLDRYAHSKHGLHIISDIAMLENQLPLPLLFDVAINIRHAVTGYKEYLLSKNPEQDLNHLISRIEKFSISSSDELISLFCWYYSPFFSTKRKVFGKSKWEKERHLLGCLHSTLIPKASKGTNAPTRRQIWITPTAMELARVGVRFQADTTGDARVGFSKEVLRVPVLFFDSKLETVILNLMAMERTSTGSKPITRYFQFMNELIDDVGDVKLLIKSGIVKGRWRREQDVLDLVKRVDGFASYSSLYPPMDVAIGEMKDFYKKRMSKFLVKHKPAIAWASTVAAASLLLAAVITSKRRQSLD